MVASWIVVEALGTFMLVLTAGLCDVNRQQWAQPWALAAMTVALGHAFLGYVDSSLPLARTFNPAVYLGQWLSNQVEKFMFVPRVVGVQFGVALVAGLIYPLAAGKASACIGPDQRYTIYHAATVEALYTFMLTFVYVCVFHKHSIKGYIVSEKEYRFLAVGLVYIAGGYAAGGISGGYFNPAITLGLGISTSIYTGNYTNTLINTLVYIIAQLVGSLVAAGLYYIVVPNARRRPDDQHHITRHEKCLCEFTGTFLLVVTVGLNLFSGSTAVPWSEAACYMSMVYAVGIISGGHFNPLFSICAKLEVGKFDATECVLYCLMHILGSLIGGAMMMPFRVGNKIPLFVDVQGTQGAWLPLAGCCLTFVFTTMFVLVYMRLYMDKPINHLSDERTGFARLAIGLFIIGGGFAIGGIALGTLNPAVTLGVSLAQFPFQWHYCLFLVLAELLSAGAALGLNRQLNGKGFYGQ